MSFLDVRAISALAVAGVLFNATGCRAGDDPRRAADLYTDCIEQENALSEPCSRRAMWVVDDNSPAYNACVAAETKEHPIGFDSRSDLMARVWQEVRACVYRTGRERTLFDRFVHPSIHPDSIQPPIHTDSASTERRAPWRGTPWDNEDSIQAGLHRGDCWPLVEDSTAWGLCLRRVRVSKSTR